MEFPMTINGKNKIDKELEHLIKVEREEIKAAIAEARAHGDLKENAEYKAAKEKQSIIEGRIAELQAKVANAKVVDITKLNTSKIVFGATVTIYDEGKDLSLTYQIVGEDEADLKNGMVSFSSPLGKSLIGREEGDEVKVHAPKGIITYVVENVEFK